jgi:hypothetical protein
MPPKGDLSGAMGASPLFLRMQQQVGAHQSLRHFPCVRTHLMAHAGRVFIAFCSRRRPRKKLPRRQRQKRPPTRKRRQKCWKTMVGRNNGIHR